MRTSARAAAATGVAVLLLTWAGSSAGAGGSGHQDQTSLVWTQVVDEAWSAARVVVSGDGGGAVRELTRPGPGVFDIDPQISPDGRLVLFERDAPDSARIALVGIDGRGERLLEVACDAVWCAELTPMWDVDGRHVLFTQVRGPIDELGNAASALMYRTDLRTGRTERFSEPGIDGVYEDSRPSVAPDGTIVFTRLRNPTVPGTDPAVAVFRMDRDASSVRQLTPWELGGDHAKVSTARSGPGRGLIVFETYGTGGAPAGVHAAVATVPLDCRSIADCTARIRYLTSPTGPERSFNPDFSPDGRRVVHVRADVDGPRGDIWTVRTDGGGDARPVSTSPLFEMRPDWGVQPRR